MIRVIYIKFISIKHTGNKSINTKNTCCKNIYISVDICSNNTYKKAININNAEITSIIYADIRDISIYKTYIEVTYIKSFYIYSICIIKHLKMYW